MRFVLVHSPAVGPSTWRWVAEALRSAGHAAIVPIPPCEETFRVGGEFLGTLRGWAENGVLPRWSEWWGDGVLEALVPDDGRRHTIEAELPRVPLAFYEAAIDLPATWCRGPGAYVLLSEAYRTDASKAAALISLADSSWVARGSNPEPAD